MTPVLPETDIWFRAFSRKDPDPLTVHAMGQLIRERRVVLVGWIRQALLTRARDERQLTRLRWALSGFPEVVVRPVDHELAASLTRRLRDHGQLLAPWPALLWAISDRLGGEIWSRDRVWLGLADQGCPLHRR